MKFLFRFIIAVFAIAGNLDAQVAPKSKVKQIFLEYKSPNKTIEIKDTYFTVSDKKDSFSNPVSSIPSSSTYEDKNYTLTKKEVYDLIKFIEDNNFFDLDPAYGAPVGERNDPTALFIKMHGKEKEVIYRSNPSYESAPEIFRKIEEYILKLRK